MATLDWLWNNAGTVIATITGVTGAILGGISYRRVSKMKALDLRLELQKAMVDRDEALSDLPKLIAKAKSSRIAVASATGNLRSGHIESFKTTIDLDLAEAQRLAATVKLRAAALRKLSPNMLEERLVEVHRQKVTIKKYEDKYHAELAADERERAQIQTRMRSTP